MLTLELDARICLAAFDLCHGYILRTVSGLDGPRLHGSILGVIFV